MKTTLKFSFFLLAFILFYNCDDSSDDGDSDANSEIFGLISNYGDTGYSMGDTGGIIVVDKDGNTTEHSLTTALSWGAGPALDPDYYARVMRLFGNGFETLFIRMFVGQGTTFSSVSVGTFNLSGQVLRTEETQNLGGAGSVEMYRVEDGGNDLVAYSGTVTIRKDHDTPYGIYELVGNFEIIGDNGESIQGVFWRKDLDSWD